MIHLALSILAFLFLLWFGSLLLRWALVAFVAALVYPIMWWDRLFSRSKPPR